MPDIVGDPSPLAPKRETTAPRALLVQLPKFFALPQKLQPHPDWLFFFIKRDYTVFPIALRPQRLSSPQEIVSST